VLRIWDHARREFRVDESRSALCGISQGGHGAWFIGARTAARWTSIVPICGYGRARSVASRVARTPVWAFHGLRDDVVDPADSRTLVSAIRAERERLGLDPAEARLTLYAQANHDSWDSAFAEPELPGWILSRAPAAAPARRR
jgi:predicted peptidase